MFKRKCKITFIAHGATVYSESHRFCEGGSYPPLNENGYQQIINILEFIKRRGVKNDKIIVSPALRTLQSAEILSKELKKEFEIVECLKPRNYGVWCGLTVNQIEEKYLDDAGVGSTVLGKTPLDGENLIDFNERIKICINKIVEKNNGKRLLVVTHPSIIRSAISSALKIANESQDNIYIKTGSATQLSYFENGIKLIYCGYVPV